VADGGRPLLDLSHGQRPQGSGQLEGFPLHVEERQGYRCAKLNRDIGDHPGLEYRLRRVGVTKRRHVAVEITPEQDDEGKTENRDLGF